MSMTHQAFLFDYDNFLFEFSELLIESLVENNEEILIDFIERNIEQIKDPYEGLPLEKS